MLVIIIIIIIIISSSSIISMLSIIVVIVVTNISFIMSTLTMIIKDMSYLCYFRFAKRPR